MRQCDPVVRALALRSGDSGFKTRSDHSLNLFLVVPGSTSQRHLQIANWFASGRLGFLTVVVVVFCCFVEFIVNRGEWFGSSANIKGANKDAKI